MIRLRFFDKTGECAPPVEIKDLKSFLLSNPQGIVLLSFSEDFDAVLEALKGEEKEIRIRLPDSAYISEAIREYNEYLRGERKEIEIAFTYALLSLESYRPYFRETKSYSDIEIETAIEAARPLYLAPLLSRVDTFYYEGISYEELREALRALGKEIEERSQEASFVYSYYIPIRHHRLRGPLALIHAPSRVNYVSSSPRLFSKEPPDEIVEIIRRKYAKKHIPVKRNPSGVSLTYSIARYDFYDRGGEKEKEEAIEEILSSERRAEKLISIALEASRGAPSEYHAAYLNASSLVYEISKTLLKEKKREELSRLRTSMAQYALIKV